MEQAQLKQLQDLQLNLKKDEEHLDYEEERYYGKWQDKRRRRSKYTFKEIS